MSKATKTQAQMGVVGTANEQIETVAPVADNDFEADMLDKTKQMDPKKGYFYVPPGDYMAIEYVLRKADPIMPDPVTGVKGRIVCTDISTKIKTMDGQTTKIVSVMSVIKSPAKQMLAIAKKHGFDLKTVAPLNTTFADLPWTAIKHPFPVRIETKARGDRTVLRSIVEVQA